VGGDVVRLDGGHAALDLALPDDLPPGPLELIAYVVPSGVGPEAHAWGVDTRRVYLRPSGAPADADLGAGELDVRLYAQRTAYLPGEPASVSVRVSDAARAGQRSVLSVALVSAEASPALPRPSPGPQAGARGLAVLRSKVLSVSHPLPPGTERDFEAVARTRQVRRDALSGPATRIVWATLALVGLSWFAVAAGASPRTRRGWFARLLGGLLLLALAAGASLLLAYGGTLLLGPGLAILLCLLWLGALLAFGVQVVQRRDHWGQFLWAVTAATLALVLGLGYARQQGAPLASAWILAAWGAGLALALALYLYGLRWARGGAAHAAAAVWATASVLLITVASVALAPVSGRAVESAEEALATRVAAYRPADDGALSDLNGGEAAVTLPVVPSQPPSGAFRQVTALETAYWLPEARTTIYGDRAIEVPLPDLVGQARGAWRLAVHAWGPDGATGQAEMLLSLSRSLWIEAPLPAALTVGDELDLPVSVYNPLPITQTVSLAPREASWYSVRGSVVPTLTVPGRDVGRWVLPLTAREPGAQRLEVVASGEQGQDVYSAALWVAPSGGRVWRVYDGQLPPVQAVSPADSDDLSSTSLPAPQGPITAPLPSDTWLFRYPWLALRDTDRLTVTLYARAADVLAEGLAALPVPAHPVPLAELAAAARGQLVQPDALSERQAALLYQRILSYEAPEGGFGAWPGQAPDLYSSAEALACLHDLARVIYVDPALLDRTAAWLIAQQTDRNTWTAPALPSWERLPRLELPVTAHLAGSLIEAGYGETPEVRLAAEHLARYLDKAEDPYLLALVSHVLVAYDGARAASASEGQTARLAPPALDRLAELAQPAGSGEHRQVAWLSEIETWGGATGAAAGVESTALADTALLRSEAQPELVAQALAWLVEQRDARGVWGAPQTQWLVVRALAAAAEQALSSDPDATLETAQVYVTVGEVAAAPQTLVRGNAQPEQAPVVLSFDGLARGYNEIVLSRGGLGEVRYRIVGSYWMPWDELPASSPDEGVSFGLAYSPTSSAVGEWIAASVTVTPTRESTAAGIVLELGLPPGMEVEEGAWQVLVEEGTVDRYQRVGQAMHVHLSGFPEEGLLEFSYRLRAAYPLAVWAPPSYAYPAGDPLRAAVRAPVWMEVH